MEVGIRLIALGLLLAVAGCGGGGGGDAAAGGGGGAQAAAPAPTTGVIKVLFGDGPVDGFDQVLMAVEEVRLLSDDGQNVLLVDGPITIDLLQLRNVSELVVDKVVDAGIYNKIRMLVQSVTLVKLDDDGMVEEEVEARLVANGKVDLNPQGVIDIGPGEDLVVEVEIDVDRSVHIHKTGNGEYRFRPVVFVNVIEQDPTRLLRLFGQMQNIDTDSGTLELCNVELLSGSGDVPEEGCLPIVLLPGTLLVGADGMPTVIENLIEGDFATVLARFRYGLEADDNRYEAVLLAVGEEGNFQQLFGDVVTAVTDGAFELDRDDADENVEVRLVDGAVVLNDDNVSVGPGAIMPGQQAELWGLFVTEEDVEHFRSFLVHLDDDDDTTTSVSGTLVSIDLQADQLTLQDAELTEVCVQLDDDTVFFQLNEDDERVEGGVIAIGDLAMGEDTFIEAFGEFDDVCLQADEVVIETTNTE